MNYILHADSLPLPEAEEQRTGALDNDCQTPDLWGGLTSFSIA